MMMNSHLFNISAFPSSAAHLISQQNRRSIYIPQADKNQSNQTSEEDAIDSMSRRNNLVLLSTSLVSSSFLFSQKSLSQTLPTSYPPSIETQRPLALPNYALQGPLLPIRLPQLEHTCSSSSCGSAPADRARLKIHAWVPKGGTRLGLKPPYPLAIITPGFLIAASQYETYAERLASWGYCAVIYDVPQQPLDPISDTTCVNFLRDLLDWCRSNSPLGALCDTDCVYLIGHSRGGKISTLAAAEDSRVKALFLIDPVDVTVYAPLSIEYPSAVDALSSLEAQRINNTNNIKNNNTKTSNNGDRKTTTMTTESGGRDTPIKDARGTRRALPLAVIGSGRGGDCVPSESNYERFFAAAPSAAFEAIISDAGHLQFLDSRSGSGPMDLVCATGKVRDDVVGDVTRALMVSFGEAILQRRQAEMSVPENLPTKNNQSNNNLSNNGAVENEKDTTTINNNNNDRIYMGIDEDGRIIAGVASFDSLQTIYATENNVRTLIKNKYSGYDVDISTRAKNFDLM